VPYFLFVIEAHAEMEGTAIDVAQRIVATDIERLIAGYTPQIIRRDPDSPLLIHQNAAAGDE
jgi:hypothetical protein